MNHVCVASAAAQGPPTEDEAVTRPPPYQNGTRKFLILTFSAVDSSSPLACVEIAGASLLTLRLRAFATFSLNQRNAKTRRRKDWKPQNPSESGNFGAYNQHPSIAATVSPLQSPSLMRNTTQSLRPRPSTPLRRPRPRTLQQHCSRCARSDQAARP